MAIHSSILAWRIPWTEEPGRLQSMGSQRVGHDWINLACRRASHLRTPQLHALSNFPPISILLVRKSRLRETASLGRIFERLSRGAGERKEQTCSSMNLYSHEFIQRASLYTHNFTDSSWQLSATDAFLISLRKTSRLEIDLVNRQTLPAKMCHWMWLCTQSCLVLEPCSSSSPLL